MGALFTATYPAMVERLVMLGSMARYQRQTASPSAIRRLIIANDQIDVRAILPQVRRPTLVMQRRGDLIVRCGNGRYLADHIPDAVYLELPGADHLVAEGDMEAIVDAIDHFADASWVREPGHHAGRFLATVLFTDVVGSTALAARLGDRAWRDLLQRFHALMAHIESGRLVRVVRDWCPPFVGYHLYYPSKRQPSPAFSLVVKALRFCGSRQPQGRH